MESPMPRVPPVTSTIFPASRGFAIAIRRYEPRKAQVKAARLPVHIRIEMLNAAIVGLGRWGQRLVEAVSTPPSVAIRFAHAVVRTPDKVGSFCSTHGL